ncbi:XRE family transcriptional regulator [Levilactobacillus bambusae]|uniref:Transcriptional regulator n=1 Tax=Levilactobacillus bambusae TaxID=2024736 RepID=A0A2V1N599_9LACO|nr:XRE family transcriptional regulator [Levilactobacillus bambusae]PWG00985.1 transcriptional regulator [Levilactobacillus bambusae]
MSNNILANNIIDLRESHNMSQTELARRLEIDKSSMSKIESGNRKVSSDELKHISDIFNVSTDYLLGKKSFAARNEPIDLGKSIDDDDLMTFDGKPLTDDDKEIIKRLLRGKE